MACEGQGGPHLVLRVESCLARLSNAVMLLEQQNKKKDFMMARQEQDNMSMPRGPDGYGGQAGPGYGSQRSTVPRHPPQGPRFCGTSPNPGDQMKRGHTSHESRWRNGVSLTRTTSRGSPGAAAMNFNIASGPMDPSGHESAIYSTVLCPTA